MPPRIVIDLDRVRECVDLLERLLEAKDAQIRMKEEEVNLRGKLLTIQSMSDTSDLVVERLRRLVDLNEAVAAQINVSHTPTYRNFEGPTAPD